MAVYTQLDQQQVTDYLEPYNLGELVCFKGISGGVENTNYFVTTQVPGQPKHDHVLTLFEDLAYDELPYFVALTEHLVAHGITVPAPLRDEFGTALKRLAARPALLFPRFPGEHLPRSAISPKVCAIMGQQLASLHKAGQRFDLQRQAHRGQVWWTQLGPRAAQCLSDNDAELLLNTINAYQGILEAGVELPRGVVHGDLFHDNALFEGEQFSAIIDLYNACHDFLLYDVAVAVNDWCIKADGSMRNELYMAFINAYHQTRPFTKSEAQYWPVMLQTAAMRFWLSRLETYHGLDSHQREAGVTVLKDPDAIRDILRLRQKHLHLLPV
ncbi:MAG: homoserine kinase [Gammaproteobacteria bacterium]|jgi:homoserine kinase type II|nr:homoserine kinase [Gammaproteobacteria bacterium]